MIIIWSCKTVLLQNGIQLVDVLLRTGRKSNSQMTCSLSWYCILICFLSWENLEVGTSVLFIDFSWATFHDFFRVIGLLSTCGQTLHFPRLIQQSTECRSFRRFCLEWASWLYCLAKQTWVQPMGWSNCWDVKLEKSSSFLGPWIRKFFFFFFFPSE